MPPLTASHAFRACSGSTWRRPMLISKTSKRPKMARVGSGLWCCCCISSLDALIATLKCSNEGSGELHKKF
ncbi:unnamed protein product [Ectocarpus sp. CCAP 1310/34]|nr:unnamed protein product [Ectocarpus sp. CCAP 1310/34]